MQDTNESGDPGDSRRKFLSRTGVLVGATLAASVSSAFAESAAKSKTLEEFATDEEKKLLTATAAKTSKADILSLLTSHPTNKGLSLEYKDLRSIRAAFDNRLSEYASGVHPADNCCCCCPCCCCSAASVANPIRGV
jgi:hypothetical protein